MPVRRLVGTLLVVAVLATALVVTALPGLRTAGQAVVARLPADPVVGDCVFDTARHSGSGPDSPIPSSTIPLPHNDAQPLPAATKVSFGPCTGQPVVGEVVAVATGADEPDGRPVSASAGSNGCRGDALRYAGLVPHRNGYELVDQVPTDPVRWDVSVNFRTTWVDPTPVLRSSGRDWSACVVTTIGITEYDGRVAGAYVGGRLPDAFGTCWDSPRVRVAGRTVNCDEPHSAELVAVGTVADRSSTGAAGIRQSCERLSAGVMGRGDPTASGSLSPSIAPDYVDSTVGETRSLDVICFIVPIEHSLAGTLVGLGERPVPFTS